MTVRSKRAKSVAANGRKARSISSTTAEWDEISARAKAAGQSISAYAVSKAINPPNTLVAKTSKTLKPISFQVNPDEQVLVLTEDQQRELYNSVQSLAKTGEDISNFTLYGELSAMHCIEIIYKVMFDYMAKNDNIDLLTDIVGEVRYREPHARDNER